MSSRDTIANAVSACASEARRIEMEGKTNSFSNRNTGLLVTFFVYPLRLR